MSKSKAMLSHIYEEKCNNCTKDIKCHLCKDFMCKSCTVMVEDKACCRPCSASLRNDENLVCYFIRWHSLNNFRGVKLTKVPTLILHKHKKGNTFSVVEFQAKNIIGSIIYRSDAQCDVDAINTKTGNAVFIEYRILVNDIEINEFLQSVYHNIQRLNA